MEDGTSSAIFMSSTETREIISAYYAAFNRGDWEGMLALLTSDVTHDANEGCSEQGLEKFRAFLHRMAEHYSEQVEDLVVFSSESGTRAAAEFFIRGKYLKTDAFLPEAKGQDYRLPVGAFFDLRDGKISRVTNYYNLNQWIKMVS